MNTCATAWRLVDKTCPGVHGEYLEMRHVYYFHLLDKGRPVATRDTEYRCPVCKYEHLIVDTGAE